MRVLNLMWGFNIGGVGKCFLMYDQLGFDNTELCLTTACINLKNIKFNLAPLLEIKAHIISIESRKDLSWIPKCHNLIKQIKPDIIFTHGFNGPVVVTVLRLFYNIKMPFVCSYHGEYHPPSVSRKLVGPLFNKCAHHIYRNYATGVVCVCEFSKRYLIEQGVAPNKIEVVHNGLPLAPVLEKSMVLRHQLGIPDHTVVIGTVSRIDPVKGLDFLLDAIASLQNAGRDTALVLVGTGSLVDQLQKKAETLGIADKFYLVGFQKNVLEWLSIFDIFVLPSLAEYHSLGLLEAMRAQMAIVATAVGGNTESVRNEIEALIVPPADSSALRDAILRLIDSPDLRRKFAIAARQRFETLFVENITRAKLSKWLLSFKHLI